MKPLFRDRICAVVAAPTAREMQAQLRQALKRTRTIELRLDYLKSDRQVEEALHWLRDHPVPAAVIATARRRSTGGRLRNELTLEMAALAMLAAYHGGWCDTDISTCREQPDEVLRLFLKKTRCIVSFHDFRATPKKLAGIVTSLEQFRRAGEAIKVATQCNSLRDALRVLALCKGRRDVIAVPMGEIGLPARVLALKHGSALAYAAMGEKTAPGQLTLDEMKNLYRADKLNRRTRVYGVIGDPVAHSLSPLMHNTAFHARRINAVYLPFLVRDLRDFVGAIKPLGIAGFSVTLPHKERILPHLDDCDPLAARIGAVNTVVVRGGGKLYGYNTDYVGVLRALERRVRIAGSRVLLYGAGGVARAVAFALAQGGAVACVCARRPARARKLARAVGGQAIERRQLRREFFDAIVNCTPVGMHPRAGASPLRAAELNCRLVFDTVYRPTQTKLLQLARRRGIETVSGVEMFVAQGTAQWEIWMGQRAPEEKMRGVVLAALRKQE
jgi:3-dehydroquinate dehydratase/shikimate dehydrogenase